MRGGFMQVMDVTAFTPLEEYQQGVRAFLNGMKATPPAPGFDEVLVPGDHEHNSRVERLEKGVEVWDKTIGRIQECVDKLGVDLGEGLVEASDEARYQ